MSDKKGISGVVETILLILIVVIAIGILVAFLIPFVRKNLDEAGSCIDTINQIKLNPAYTCYYSSGGNTGMLVNIEVEKLKIDEIVILLSGGGESKNIKIKNGTLGSNDLNMYRDTPPWDDLVVPRENEGKTYWIPFSFTGQPNFKYYMSKVEQVKIAPIIKGKQCDIVDDIFVKICSSNVELSSQQTQISCSDSDGLDPNVKGTTTGKNALSGIIETKTDFCLSTTEVSEYSCSGEFTNSGTISCASGYICSDGRCVVNNENKDVGNTIPGLVIFVSSQSFFTNMGISGADNICNSDGAAIKTGKTWKALIGTTNRQAAGSDWVLKPLTSYHNINGELIGTTDDKSWFTLPLNNPINNTQSYIIPIGLDSNGNVLSSLTCSSWTSTSQNSEFESGLSSAINSQFIQYSIGGFNPDGSVNSCTSAQRIYCVEQ